MNTVVLTWTNAIEKHWDGLVKGEEYTIPKSRIIHPMESGFYAIALAEPCGQWHDYGMSLDDGSRIHVHEYADRYDFHRDKYDPSRGVFAAVRHYLDEAPSSKPALTIGLLVAGLATIGRIIRR